MGWCLKTMMFFFNGTISIGGLCLLGIGIWVKADGGSFLKFLNTIDPQLTPVVHVGYLCIALGAFLVVIGFLGCFGAVKESPCVLMTFFIIILILFIVEIAGAVLSLVFASMAEIFIEHLGNKTVKYLKEDYGRSNDLTKLWNITMKEMKCCGFYGYEDFSNSTYYTNNHEYPPICCANKSPCQRDNIDSKSQGCYEAFQHFLAKNGKIVGGVALAICGLELITMLVTLVLFCEASKQGG